MTVPLSESGVAQTVEGRERYSVVVPARTSCSTG